MCPGVEAGEEFDAVVCACGLPYLSRLGEVLQEASPPPLPLSDKYGTVEAVKARFWPWLSGSSP